MINLQYHKGSFCLYKSLFCQEGYCSSCEIAQELTSSKPMSFYYGASDARKLQQTSAGENHAGHFH